MLDIPFDTSFHFDENLQDVPNSPDEMRQAVQFLQSQIHHYANDKREQINVLGLIGSYARILRDFPTARQALTSALELCESIKNEKLRVINLIRLANLYQWQQQYDISENIFEKVITQGTNNPELKFYLDFAYQHFAKCKFEQGKYEQAQIYFQKALELRKLKNEQLLIDSTQLALDKVQQRINI